jgi:radical SAM superfamily enzyme YgiQ (UPF0313 family)
LRVLTISGSRAKLPDPVYPLGAAMVATAAANAGHDVAWFDALQHRAFLDALRDKIESVSPEVFLLSIRNIDSAAFPSPERYVDDHKSIVQVIREISDAPLVLGGSGFSLMPEVFLEYLGGDVGVVGDGERQIVEILSALERGDRPPRIIHAPAAAPPFLKPDRRLFDADWYYLHGGVANVQTKRGCPLKCIYCTYPQLEGSCLRKSEPGEVVDELESLIRLGIDHFFFVDTSFNASETHAAEVCEEILRRSLKISFAGYFIPRGRLPELPSLLKRAGCTAAELGTDALSGSVLLAMKKGFTVDDVFDFSNRMRAEGIPLCHNLIMGGPGETEATMDESVRRMDEIEPTAVILTIGLRVFPGTELDGLTQRGEVLAGNQLEPVFYIEETVADTIVEKCAKWTDERPSWICPGLGRRYNPRYLERLRLHQKRKGPLWPMF